MKDELDTYLKTLVEKKVFPGCHYGIVTNQEEIFGNVGYKSLIPKKEENELDNLYDIASITKLLVTNTIISFLIRDGKIKLEDSVKSYLKEFPYEDVKILHLLTHSSGIKTTFDKYHISSKDSFITKLERIFKPGENVQYVDVNFIILGFIIEKVSDKTLDVLAKEWIFEPLEMNDTTFNPNNKSRCVPMELTKDRGLIWGTVHDEKAAFLRGVAGHAGVFSNILDMSHFLSMILQDGFYHGKEFLEKKYIDLWFSPLFIGEDGVRRTIGWIYGKSAPSCKTVCGDDTIYHTGFPGHHILIDRTNDIAFIFLSNSIHPFRENRALKESRKAITEEIYKLLKKYDLL